MAKKTTAPAETAAGQPYYLQRAHIKDFRSIRDAKVEFKPGLNIMIGANGAGKTNFVKIVGNGLRGNLLHDNLTLSINGRLAVDIEVLKKKKATNDFPFVVDAVFYTMNFSSGKNTVQTSILPLGMLQIATKNGIEDGHFFDTLILNHGIPTDYSIVRNQRSMVAGSSDRTHITESEEKLGQSIVWQIREEASLRAVSVLSEANNLKLGIRKTVANHIAVIKTDIIKFTPIDDVRLSGAMQVYHNSIQREFIINGLVLEFKIGKEWLPFDALSSGTQRLFYLVSEICIFEAGNTIMFPKKRNRNSQVDVLDKIIILEEPELGIHPDQLHLLLEFLREQSKKHQLIITTHSPQVLDMLNDDELDRITICELDEKKGTQFRKLKKAQIATAQQFMAKEGLFLSDYWRYGNLEKRA